MIDLKNLLDPILILLVIIFTGFSIYTYKATNPPVSKRIKYLLTAIRSLALILLLLAIFNSIAGFVKTDKAIPVNLFFIDNSKSIAVKDSAHRLEISNKFISDFSNSGSSRFYLFGSGIDSLKGKELNFKDKSTCFSDIEKFIERQKLNAASITILSDGIITDGANPAYSFEKFSIPVYTVGIGDSTLQSDVVIHEPRNNELVYKNRPAAIEAGITNTGFSGKSITAKLYEGDNILEQKTIFLSNTGIDNVKFSYTPKTTGEKRLRISIPPFNNESNINNNSKSFVINVLNDKIKTYLISSVPSPDVSILVGMILKDERIKLKSVVELSGSKITKGGNSDFPLDSADLFILAGYPSVNSDAGTYNQIKFIISQKNKPFLVSVSSSSDLKRLKELGRALPFDYSNVSNDETSIEVHADNINNPFINPSDSRLWGSLPPLLQLKTEIIPAPESQVILKAKIKNTRTDIPVLLTRQLINNKSAVLIAQNYWKWKLQSGSQTEFLFDNLISNLLKWLNTPADKKFFSIKSGKKVYLNGEKIELTAQLYDNLFNPVENAEIKLRVSSDAADYETILPYTGGGIYSAELENIEAGNLKIKASVSLFNTAYSDSITLYVDKNDLERIRTQMDTDLLKQMASVTKGNYFLIDNYSELRKKLDDNLSKKSGQVKEYFEFRFAENKIILIILIMLFAIEWFVRKTYRLI